MKPYLTTSRQALGWRAWVGVLLGLAVSLAFLDFWGNLGTLLSPSYLQRNGVAQWGVLLLCGLWLWMKRGEVRLALGRDASTPM